MTCASIMGAVTLIMGLKRECNAPLWHGKDVACEPEILEAVLRNSSLKSCVRRY